MPEALINNLIAFRGNAIKVQELCNFREPERDDIVKMSVKIAISDLF